MTDRTLTTYRRADGKLIDGLYGWVTDIDCYGDLDESVEIVEEVWALTSTRRFVIGETDRWCEVCDEDVTLPEPAVGTVLCAACAEVAARTLAGMSDD